MRLTVLTCLAALGMNACMTVPAVESPQVAELAAIPGATPGMVAAAQATTLYQGQQAQLRDIRNAEARVDLARARLDFDTVRNRASDDGEVREFLDARRSLRRLRNVYGPTNTGRRDFHFNPFGYGRHWPRRDGWLGQYSNGRDNDEFSPVHGDMPTL
ncbi:hypothetical protein [uncultured Algimonas sp.]|uniref:hypothetical protein n=1 Tax=uncultured Algimonas sp. TaxID=1547920 RepID=UPI0026334FB3|nr:hypothetical protein [uncultured Algimonas sp.]